MMAKTRNTQRKKSNDKDEHGANDSHRLQQCEHSSVFNLSKQSAVCTTQATQHYSPRIFLRSSLHREEGDRSMKEEEKHGTSTQCHRPAGHKRQCRARTECEVEEVKCEHVQVIHTTSRTVVVRELRTRGVLPSSSPQWRE